MRQDVVNASPSWVVGWDIGGAHLKACLLKRGQVFDVRQLACPLWQGLGHLDRALDAVLAAWPVATGAGQAVTMTGEMVDLFTERRDGVERIAERVYERLPVPPLFFAGPGAWCPAEHVASRWHDIASANWLATACHAAQRLGDGVLVDIGSTTTDFIAFAHGQVLGTSRSDAQRLASGELVYHGVVRTPLCAVARRVRWRDAELNVMNEFFATSADVYRLTGELNPAHDLHPSADNADKDIVSSQRRLGRMVGLDVQDGTTADWEGFAHAWRSEQLAELESNLQRVFAAQALRAQAPLVSAGCGDFLVRSLAASQERPCLAYGNEVASIAPDARADAATWAQVCAPSVAVATLFARAGGT